ncbi:MAG: hypothetical protein ACJ74J_16815 [Blastocatellia bacterium]
MATTKKKPSPSSSQGRRQTTSDSRKSYVRLRTLLDAFEIAAVRYYLEGDSTADKNRRADDIESQIRPILAQLNQHFAQGCPPGLNNCGGCCVPYPCPSDL